MNPSEFFSPSAGLAGADDVQPDPRGDQAAAGESIRRGLALLHEGTKAALEEAIVCFERTIALRSNAPDSGDPWERYALSAGWLNRGEALAKLGRPGHLAEAVRSYDAALALLTASPRPTHPMWRKREAIAWLNRGVALRQQGGSVGLKGARDSLDRVVDLFPIGADGPEERRILGCAWINRGGVLLHQGGAREAASALRSARIGLGWLKDLEDIDGVSAEAGFKGRHIACAALAHFLEAPTQNDPALALEWLNEATDRVDEGMELGRRWALKGDHRYRPLVLELFRFGARVYQRYQPHFLIEFLMETLDPERSPGALTLTPEVHEAAIAALWRSLGSLRRDGFRSMNSADFQQWLTTLDAFPEVERRLNELRIARSGEAIAGKMPSLELGHSRRP